MSNDTGMQGGAVREASQADFDRHVASGTCIVDFTAKWCGPCQQIAPAFEELASRNGHVTFLKVDVDKEKALAQRCGIKAMPTFQLYKGGKLTEIVQGASVSRIEELLRRCPSPAGNSEQIRRLS